MIYSDNIIFILIDDLYSFLFFIKNYGIKYFLKNCIIFLNKETILFYCIKIQVDLILIFKWKNETN